MNNESDTIFDPLLGVPVEVRFLQPFQAKKTYICPSCGHEIFSGTGHYVVVPIDAADMRRHWHRPCWERTQRACANRR